MKQYLPIIRDSPVYPIIYDSNGVVLSMPPIINSDHSKITLNTKNIFLEITATDLTKAKVVLDSLVTTFSVYCGEKFTVEYVDVVSSTGDSVKYPELAYRIETIDPSAANSYIGTKYVNDFNLTLDKYFISVILTYISVYQLKKSLII